MPFSATWPGRQRPHLVCPESHQLEPRALVTMPKLASPYTRDIPNFIVYIFNCTYTMIGYSKLFKPPWERGLDKFLFFFKSRGYVSQVRHCSVAEGRSRLAAGHLGQSAGRAWRLVPFSDFLCKTAPLWGKRLNSPVVISYRALGLDCRQALRPPHPRHHLSPRSSALLASLSTLARWHLFYLRAAAASPADLLLTSQAISYSSFRD